ncbi:hypothetical protein CAEBREN_29867 [Caenorhabditis brenneri]|uniref:Uncharacterized protein n=1 Tax=Caenorhabditis brenneri TaxID=135651 RepID=G0PH14_CAEBE|nr:hypothetical protein CAEBREN_29867 [Caenorhabditis brenneri]
MLSDAQGCDEDIQSKLLALNGLIEHDQLGPNNHHRAPFNHSGLSEDSDYTSDVSVPVNHHQLHPNSSAHQYESHLHPHRSRQQQLLHTREGAASYEDEEDAYHARNQYEDPHQDYHHHQTYYDDYTSAPSGSGYTGYNKEDTVTTPVREYGGGGDNTSVPPGPSSSSRYGYHDDYDTTTPMSSGRQEPILEHNEPEYVYDHHNGYEEEDGDDYGINPTYSEEQFDGPPGTRSQEMIANDFRNNDYSNSSYQREYWNESEPLSYNSRPPNGHVRTGSSAWREPGTSSRPTSSQAWNYTDDTHQYDEVDRGSRHSFTRTPSVDRAERRSDSGGGYYDEFGER